MLTDFILEMIFMCLIAISNKDVLNFMFENDLMHCRKSVSSFDFSTLCTSIPHNQVKDNLTKFVNRIFEIKDKTYIVCNEFSRIRIFLTVLT
jgi:hypothetical protein